MQLCFEMDPENGLAVRMRNELDICLVDCSRVSRLESAFMLTEWAFSMGRASGFTDDNCSTMHTRRHTNVPLNLSKVSSSDYGKARKRGDHSIMTFRT